MPVSPTGRPQANEYTTISSTLLLVLSLAGNYRAVGEEKREQELGAASLGPGSTRLVSGSLGSGTWQVS